MFGLIFYVIAILLYMGDPITNLWLIAFGIGILFHFKFWAVGIVAFFIGAGFKRPF